MHFWQYSTTDLNGSTLSCWPPDFKLYHYPASAGLSFSAASASYS
jgi:hypothetical protein